MMSAKNILKTAGRQRLSFQVQTLCAVAAIAGAVAVPQVFHALGAISGLGTAPGKTFLPMHLPIILVGLLAGPYAGAVAGVCGPLASFALSGMPFAAELPFMMIELGVYGLSAGLLGNAKLPTIAKVVLVQISGRAVRAAALLLVFYAFGNGNVQPASIWTSVTAGIFGLALQWALLPLIVYRVENAKKNEGGY